MPKPYSECSDAEKARRDRFHTFMQVYWAARQAYEEELESQTALYESEVAAYRQTNPGITFKRYLIDSAGMHR